LVLALKTDDTLELKEIIEILMQINKHKSHNTLCRGLQDCLQKLFSFKNCVVLFKDSKRDQFFNIVLSGEDDRNNAFKTKLAEYQDRIKKLKADSPQKNKDAIQIFKSEVQRMITQH
jgi:hypothetical protein